MRKSCTYRVGGECVKVRVFQAFMNLDHVLKLGGEDHRLLFVPLTKKMELESIWVILIANVGLVFTLLNDGAVAPRLGVS
jgi:hypothetical protein